MERKDSPGRILLQIISASCRTVVDSAVLMLKSSLIALGCSMVTVVRRLGTPIGSFDLLIAATVLAHDATLVTNNTRKLARVPGLKLENWLQP